MTNNLKLWESVEKTNPKYTKKQTHGAKLTAIDAYSQIKHATDVFGTYGEKWGLKSSEMFFTPCGKCAVFKGQFFYNGADCSGEFPVFSSIELEGKYAIDGDFAKKVETDVITKALSRIGFNADVFLGKFDDQKYVNEMNKEFAPEPELPSEEFRKKVDRLVDEQELIEIGKKSRCDIEKKYLKQRITVIRKMK